MLSLIQEAVLLKISRAINTALQEAINLDASLDNNIESKLNNLNNKIIKVVITKFPIDLEYIVKFENNKINISAGLQSSKPLGNDSTESIDLNIKISLGSLIKARLTSVEQAIRERDIEFTGDLSIAMELQSIFNNIEINFKEILQENLAKYTSDSFAWQFVNILDKILDRINLKHSEFKEQMTDYLQTEKNILVNKYELEDFFQSVDKLRDDAARLEARFINMR